MPNGGERVARAMTFAETTTAGVAVPVATHRAVGNLQVGAATQFPTYLIGI